MSGGFTPGFRTTGTEIGYEASVLASQHGMVVRDGATFDATKVTADANGDKIVPVGTIVIKDGTTGKVEPYVPGSGKTPFGILVMASLNLKDGDVIQGVLLHGSVLQARIPNYDAAAKTAFAGAIIFQ